MNYIVILIIIIIFTFCIFKKVDILEGFIEGASTSIKSAFKIMPILLCVVTIIGIFRASGATEIISNILNPLGSMLKIPKETLPLVILRPISGSASIAMLTDIVTKYGADSMIGRIACTMTSSTETTIYAISVYGSSSNLKSTGKILISGILADLFSAVCAVFSVMMFFPF